MFKFGIDKIVGDSMSPTINDGNYVIFFSSKRMKIIPNKLYRLSHPKFGSIIKRLSYEDAGGNFWFKGDSHNSTSLKKIGAITKEQIDGRIWLTIDNESGMSFPQRIYNYKKKPILTKGLIIKIGEVAGIDIHSDVLHSSLLNLSY